jgi:hypothetical protein
MRTRSFLLTGIILFITGYGYTQDLPTIKPPPPTAMQFQKYGDYPVSHFTGVPDITIPLYTIKEGDLEVPITLSYHASGYKPTDVDGIVGLGWVLNVGGQMTRTIYDKEDEQTYAPNYGPMPTESYVTNEVANRDYNTDNYLSEILSKYHYDVFSYDFMGKHGKFIMKDYQLNQCVLLDYQPISIQGTLNGFRIGSFTVKDETGKKYVFDQTLMADYNNSDIWSISSIRSGIDATNTITYSYTTGPTVTHKSRIDTYIKDDNESSFRIYGCNNESIGMQSLMPYWSVPADIGVVDNGFQGAVPSQINFRNGRVQFVYDPVTKMLSSMDVYNKNNELIKRMRFEMYDADGISGWAYAFLKKIKLYDRYDNFINEYAFNYNEENGSRAVGQSISTDYWGFFTNGDDPYLIPKFFIEFRDLYGNAPSKYVGNSSRRSTESSMKLFQLNEITYPTGGRSVFEFEANQYYGWDGSLPPNYGSTTVGGMRIKRILSYSDANTLAGVKDYEYLESRMDIIPSRPYFTRSSNRYIIHHVQGYLGGSVDVYRRTEVSSEPIVNITPHGSPVVYPYVKEHIRKVLADGTIDENPLNSLTISYTYDWQPNNPYSFPTTNGPEGDGFYPLYAPYASVIKANTDGKLTGVTYEGNGGSDIQYEYEEIPLPEIPTFYSSRYAFYEGAPCPANMDNPDEWFYDALWGSICHFNYADVTVKPVIKRLKSTTETKQGVTTYTVFHYDNNIHNQPTSNTVTTSNGEIIKTTFEYPHEKQSGGTPNVYNEMVARHIWSPVVDEKTYKAATPDLFLQSTTTNYDYWENSTWSSGSANSLIVPRTLQTTVGTEPAETRIRFRAYDDNANVVSVEKENNMKMSYLWGYNKSYPIAEITNAEFKDMFHTSFEDETDASIAVEGKTGKKSKTGGFSQSLSNLTNGSYTLSYWQKNGSSWSLVSNLVNVTGNAYTINIPGQVDEVRFYPSTAFMTTFTFDPLVGKTSETNANNRTEYYEYDAALRLIHILDDDKNVLKKFGYNFYNSANASATAPDWQNTGNSYCEACYINPSFYTGWKISEQIDNNSNSYTYGQKKWIRELSNTCAFNYWQDTNNYMCVKDGGINTGEQMRQQVYVNPCSSAYQSTRWISLGTNTNACPVPSVFYSQDLSGYYTKDNCPADHAGGDVYVSVPASMFSSPNSLAEANAQAYAYARSVAASDPSGTCTPVPFMLQCENDTEDDIEINLYDQITGNTYTFVAHPNNGFQDLGNILPGTYEVNFHNLDDSIWYYYKLNCGNIEEEGEEVTILNVPIGSSCNQIQILE